MDYKLGRMPDDVVNSPDLMNDPLGNFVLSPGFSMFDPQSMFGVREDQFFSEFVMPMDSQAPETYELNSDVEMEKQMNSSTPIVCNEGSTANLNWDPKAILIDLSFMEQEIHKAQDVVRSMIWQDGQLSARPDELAAQQKMVTADLTSIIVHLISTAENLIPSVKGSLLSTNPSFKHLACIINSCTKQLATEATVEKVSVPETDDQNKVLKNSHGDISEHSNFDEHDLKDCEDGECENLLPGSYEVLQLEKEEILAPHTHFCQVCGKGFKRDANLRMHMRGHGNEYKTPSALAKPGKELSSDHTLIKRYSCPVLGCKRNKEHKKFQPLKTILCVKNHYKRTHCDKSYTCSRCHSKKFSVIADLKTHEKHCGRDKWLCSCGTTFSRKDKLFGHVALFQGHTPALATDEIPAPQQVQSCGQAARFDCGGKSSLDVKNLDEDPSLLSSMCFDPCSLGGFHEFPRPTFEASDVSFPFMPIMTSNCSRKKGGNPISSRPLKA